MPEIPRTPSRCSGIARRLRSYRRTTHRAVGTRLSAMITEVAAWRIFTRHRYRRLRGTPASRWALAVRGIKLEVFCDANDYVRQGLERAAPSWWKPTCRDGWCRAQRHHRNRSLRRHRGSCSPRYVRRRFAGRTPAADRFRGRGSTAAILTAAPPDPGSIGVNFAAGRTGGMAFVIDPENLFTLKSSGDRELPARRPSALEAVAHALVEEHVAQTKSPLGAAC